MTEPAWFPKAKEALFPRQGAKRRPVKLDAAKLASVVRVGLEERASRFRAGLDACTPAARDLTVAALAHGATIAEDPRVGDPVLFGTLMRLLAGPLDKTV